MRSSSSFLSSSKIGTNFSSAETPFVAHGGVGGAAGDREPEHERAALGRHEREAGGLGDQGRVGPVSPQDGREGTQPPVLLPHRRRHADVPAQLDPELRERVERGQVADEPTLHIARAAAVEQVALDLPGERVAAPGRRVTGRHRVHVRVQKERAPPSPAGAHPDYVRTVLVAGLLANVLLVGGDLLRRRLPDVHGEPALPEGALDHLLHRALIPRDGRDADQFLQQPHRLAAPLLHYPGYRLRQLRPPRLRPPLRVDPIRQRGTVPRSPARGNALPLDLIKVDN